MVQPFITHLKSPTQAKRALPFKPIPADGIADTLCSAFNHFSENPNRLLYVHIPFCKQTCSFCIYNCYKNSPPNTVSTYIDLIINQICNISKTKWVQSAPFNAVYFGGGTPTAIPANDLARIVESIKQNIPLSSTCEITVESTINAITSQLLSTITKAGVNRISLGVQTFDNAIRKNLGRESNNETIASKINLISQSGINNICIDLIYGLPNQTLESWQRDLDLVKQLPITGCSVYPLIAKQNGNNNAPEFSIDQEFNFFLTANNSLKQIEGWKQFTPVQYGHITKGTAMYVSGHGQNADLLALGAGAGGRIGCYTYLAKPNIEEFLACNSNFYETPKILLSIDKGFLNLRKIFNLSEGLSLENHNNNELRKQFQSEFDFLIEKGLVLETDTSLKLTQTGYFWAANISELFAKRIDVILKNRF